ncbi:Root meristem growth factor 9-like [Quillaja saponaria]|uniref:Root meristem growth factor 9-like n=1 Tax=Quillaja saponaria TaxID=32244 RepID=A0AAD7PJ95_QUISA|nr:Root meristem growth factor 9-like [Quillaja saponaria]
MAMVPERRVVLVAFLVLLCFISITARARNLRGTSTDHEAELQDSKNLFESNQYKEKDNVEVDFASVDYTPTKGNPPIHN